MGAKKLAAIYGAGLALMVGTAYTTSKCNWQGEEHLQGEVIIVMDTCEPLITYLNAKAPYAKDCKNVLFVDTAQGLYVIGALGTLDDKITTNSEIDFLKNSTRFVTSFDGDHMGLLSAEYIKPLDKPKK